MSILKDPLLSAHHMDVIQVMFRSLFSVCYIFSNVCSTLQAIEYMINSLGLKCVPYLSQIIPTYLTTIKSCESNIREVSGLLN